MNNGETPYPNEIIFYVTEILIAFSIRLFLPFEITSIFVINLIIYWAFLVFFVLVGSFIVYLRLWGIFKGIIGQRKFENMPKGKYLVRKDFYLLTSSIATTLVLEKLYLVSSEPLVITLVFVFFPMSFYASRLCAKIIC
jgi:hypothetical protein